MASPKTMKRNEELAELRKNSTKDVTLAYNDFPNRGERRKAVSKTARKLQKMKMQEIKNAMGQIKVE